MMTLKWHTPCDDLVDGKFYCPYSTDGPCDCQFYCSAEEPEDYPDLDEEEIEYWDSIGRMEF